MAYMSQERKKALAPAVKAILKEYGLTGALGVNHHSSLVLTIRSGPVDFIGLREINHHGRDVETSVPTYIQVNTYHIESHYNGKAQEVLTKLYDAMMVGNHDNSDMMSDYHDVGWYVDINVGKWDVPYVLEA